MKIDKIWLEKKNSLDKLYYDVKWLVKSKNPVHQKLGIWQTMFDNFVLRCYNQDKRIRDMVEKP